MYRVTIYGSNNGRYIQRMFDSHALADMYSWKFERRGFDTSIEWIDAKEYDEAITDKYAYPLT